MEKDYGSVKIKLLFDLNMLSNQNLEVFTQDLSLSDY